MESRLRKLLKTCASGPAVSEDLLDYLVESVASEVEGITAVTPALANSLRDLLADSGLDVEADDFEDFMAGVADLVSARAAAPAEPSVGSACVAVLAEDGDWHPAVVDALLPDGSFSVTFLEYGKPQTVTRAQLVLDSDVVPDDDDGGFGTCVMCSRDMPLTRHHVIPKETHTKYIRMGFTPAQLNTTVAICRQCHSAVHRGADNLTLAEKYNTLEKILAMEGMAEWIAYASKQRGATAAAKDAKSELRRHLQTKR